MNIGLKYLATLYNTAVAGVVSPSRPLQPRLPQSQMILGGLSQVGLEGAGVSSGMR